MEIIKWEGHISLIRGMEKHLGVEPISNDGDQLLVGDMVNEKLSTYQEFADKYTKGDVKQIIAKTEQILTKYLKFLLDLDVYHNDAQRMMSYAGTCWEGTKKMLRLGLRKGAIKNATTIYEMAICCHAFEIAGPIASTLANHCGFLTEEDDLSDYWYAQFERCTDQNFWVQEANRSYALIMRAVRNNGENKETADSIEPVMKRLKKYRNGAESYMYWYCYYEASSIVAELKGDYKDQLKMAKEGYEYFDNLALNHSDVKTGMLQMTVRAHNLLRQYKEATSFEHFLSDKDEKGANHGVLALRLACSFLNLNKIAKALKILDEITTHPIALARVPLYRSYCLGEFLDDGRTDYKHMGTAYLICDLYCSNRSGKSDRYKHDYLMDYVDEKDLVDTREGLMIEILSLLRYRDKDEEKLSEIYELIERLRTAKLHSTEAEILRFETMIEELMSK